MSAALDLHQLRFEDMNFFVEDNHLFHDISIDIPCNEVVFVFGKDGVGKSMLLRVLAGLDQIRSGKYLVNGQNIADASFEEFLPMRLNIGYSFEYGGLLSNKTIKQNLALPLEYHKWMDREDGKARVDELLTYFNLREVADLRPSSVPGSMRKAAVVARSFVLDPKILILDDPTTGLSKAVKNRLMHLLKYKLETGVVKHIFCASTDIQLAQEIGTMYLDISPHKFTVGREIVTKILEEVAGE